MAPINQVILGGDPLLGSGMMGNNLDEQIQMLDKYRQNLEVARQMKQSQAPQKLIWDEIDAEVFPLSDEQKSKLLQNEEYAEVYIRLQSLVQSEILNMVKARIENTSEGKDLLANQLRIVRKLKSKIIDDTNREMELFKSFREYSKKNPEVTYDEFIKSNTL